MDIKAIINRKRLRGELTEEEIKYFINQYMNKEITDSQAGVVLNCIYENGMTEMEIMYLAQAMAESGKKIDLGEIGNRAVDKHSTGGVGDKVTLILIPILAALGIPVSKMSSRGMGIAFGTIEKLETVPGYTTEIEIDEFKKNLNKCGVGILSQTKNLNPAENKIYKLRNEIFCVDAIPLIAASLLSLKIPTGAKNIVFEINYGKGTYIRDRKDAEKLAKLLKRVGNRLGKNVICALCTMDEPLGYSIGNNLEMIEAINALNGKMSEDLGTTVVVMACAILKMFGNNNMKENEERVKTVIRDKLALKKFKEMINIQHGDTKYIDDVTLFTEAENVSAVNSEVEGYVKSIDADIVGNITRYIGAGRMHIERLIDNEAGIVLNKKIGDYVKKGEVIAHIHTNDSDKIKNAKKNLQDAFEITPKKVNPINKTPKIIY